MKRTFFILFPAFVAAFFTSCQPSGKMTAEKFPDGSAIPAWFGDTTKVDIHSLGKQFNIIDSGAVGDSATLNTIAIQKAIDAAAVSGGGVVVIPEGRFRTGALFFKPGTHLHISEGGVLLGSDDIADFPLMPSRMEGRSIDYFPAVVNAYGVNGFTITGKGTIDGNGLKYWLAFWQRRKENPQCTNLEVSRPRLVFIQHSDSVRLQDVRLHNSGFWTTHLYKCNYAKLINLHIFSPAEPVKAPSTDAIDIDACTHVLVQGCYLSVNDDAIALKGGKGPWADTDTTNGPNLNVIIRNCTFGFCHSALTCGSEAIHNRNILFQNSHVDGADRVLWLKMRPDTPQKYEFITVEGITGQAGRLIFAKPWRQFFDLRGRESIPPSVAENIILRDIELNCKIFADIEKPETDTLKNFTFQNLKITAGKGELNREFFNGVTVKNVSVNGQVID